jgi:uncharacterized membrane protein YfcA
VTFSILVAGTALLAGAIASIAGFGIGSVLTPLLASTLGTKIAVAAVSIPHLVATAIRFWILRDHLDRRVLVSFGTTSAAGGLSGALAHTLSRSGALTIVLGVILIVSGITGLFGTSLRFRGRGAWIAGAVSGFLGGLVGNQGGVRTAAMLGLDVSKEAFVATSTAVGLVVDGVRMPVYLWSEGTALLEIGPLIAVMSGGVIAGTLLGRPILGRIPEALFKRLVSALVLILGVALLVLRYD